MGCSNETIDKSNKKTHTAINDNSDLTIDGNSHPLMATSTEGGENKSLQPAALSQEHKTIGKKKRQQNNLPNVSFENAVKVVSKKSVKSKQFSQVTASTELYGIVKNPAHPVG